MTRVAIVDVENDLDSAVRNAFNRTMEGASLLKSSGEVYLKPNAIDFKPFTYTSPDVLAAVIKYLYDIGARRVSVMENSTQGNITRFVYEITGFKDLCRRTGAKPVYLDERPRVKVTLPNFEEPVEFPRLVVEKLIDQHDRYTYINIPKLKTHSMSTVTLGIKNQMAFPRHSDRGSHHNYELHRRLADIYTLVQPDYTLIDGTYAVFNGHYPMETFIRESIDRLDILIGGQDTLATDVIAAKILGYGVDEVKHLDLIRNDGNGCGDIGKIDVYGNLSRFDRKYPSVILDEMPHDVRIIRGREMVCPEGCDLNVRILLQVLYHDFQGKGGFTILMGKGIAKEAIDSIKGRVLIAGDCAIEETRARLISRLGRRNVFTSPSCNRLAATITALCRLMDVRTMDLVPSKIGALKSLLQARLHGSKALIPKLI